MKNLSCSLPCTISEILDKMQEVYVCVDALSDLLISVNEIAYFPLDHIKKICGSWQNLEKYDLILRCVFLTKRLNNMRKRKTDLKILF